MYSYIKGELVEHAPDKIVVENNGIGYNIHVSAGVGAALPPCGSEVKIYTYLHVKEDLFSLFGFLNQEELTLFKLMLNVSGIGPKGALAIQSVLSPSELSAAVVSDNPKAISKAPGVGLKTAQKLIIELRDKINLDALLPADEPKTDSEDAFAAEKKEAQEALVSLGYAAKEAKEAIDGVAVDAAMSVEDILKASLKQMAFL